MRLRMELFVEDLDVSIGFYRDVLEFEVARRTERYASLRRGAVVLGLGPAGELPERDAPGFTRQRLAQGKGAGVEIVLELDDVEQLQACYARCRERVTVSEPLALRSWNLYDFRLADPDGYYLRITHGNAVMTRRRVLVTGRVQGVYYRDTCRQVASAAGVGGWVRNLPDGRVEAVFEGPAEAVDDVIAWTREGPPDAHVTAVDVHDEPPQGRTTFTIR